MSLKSVLRSRVRDYACYHAIQLEHGRNLYDQRWVGGRSCPAWSGAYARDLDLVRPSYEKRGCVLPVQCTLEEIGARTIYRSVDEREPRLRYRVIYFNSLALKVSRLS